MNTKEAIEYAAKSVTCHTALHRIACATSIENLPLADAFAQAHESRWGDYTTEHRENILADYVAELQTPQFRSYRVGDSWKGGADTYATTQLFQGETIWAHVFGPTGDQSRARTTLICQLLNQSGAVLSKQK